MSKERKKGTELETAVVRALHAAGYTTAHRNALHGSKDIGDIGGLSLNGHEVTVECKNEARYDIAGWLKQAFDESVQAGSDAAIVVFHQRGKGFAGIASTLRQPVLMTLGDLLEIADRGSRSTVDVTLAAIDEELETARRLLKAYDEMNGKELAI